MVVSDTGPLNYLVWIDCAAVLPALYGRVIVPEGVLHEMRHPRAPEPVRRWMTALPDWLELRRVRGVNPSLSLLGLGEREAITLALESGVDTILMDDAQARQAAVERGLATVRTLAVLARAAEQNMLNLESALERLRATSFRAKLEHYDTVLQRTTRSRI